MEQKTACYLICLGVILMISIILFALSWDTIEPVEWGLLCNSISKNCGAESDFYLLKENNNFLFFQKFTMVADISSGWLIISSHFQRPIKQSNFQLSKEPMVLLI